MLHAALTIAMAILPTAYEESKKPEPTKIEKVAPVHADEMTYEEWKKQEGIK